jgi:hypothetical protein
MDAVSIEPLLLEEEFSSIPAHLARYNHLYAQAYETFLLAKAAYDQTYSGASIKIREDATEDGKKKPTEGTINALIEVDDDVIEARLRMIKAEVEKVRLWGVLDALRAKKDALISIGAHIRAEMGGNPSVREQHRGARDVAATRGTPSDVDDDA